MNTTNKMIVVTSISILIAIFGDLTRGIEGAVFGFIGTWLVFGLFVIWNRVPNET